MSKFTREQILEKLMNRKRRMQKLELELPDLEDLNGELALRELSAGDFEDAEELSKGEDGTPRNTVEGAILITRALVMYATKERIFEDNHAEWIIREFGTLVTVPLVSAVREFCGTTGNAYEDAKKNYQKTLEKGSPTSSEKSLVAPGPGVR